MTSNADLNQTIIDIHNAARDLYRENYCDENQEKLNHISNQMRVLADEISRISVQTERQN